MKSPQVAKLNRFQLSEAKPELERACWQIIAFVHDRDPDTELQVAAVEGFGWTVAFSFVDRDGEPFEAVDRERLALLWSKSKEIGLEWIGSDEPERNVFRVALPFADYVAPSENAWARAVNAIRRFLWTPAKVK